jgi:hypothetical protein
VIGGREAGNRPASSRDLDDFPPLDSGQDPLEVLLEVRVSRSSSCPCETFCTTSAAGQMTRLATFATAFELVIFAVTDWSDEQPFIGPFREIFLGS